MSTHVRSSICLVPIRFKYSTEHNVYTYLYYNKLIVIITRNRITTNWIVKNVLRYLGTVLLVWGLVRYLFTRLLTRLQTLYNEFKYSKIWWKKPTKFTFNGTGTEPDDIRKWLQFNKASTERTWLQQVRWQSHFYRPVISLLNA